MLISDPHSMSSQQQKSQLILPLEGNPSTSKNALSLQKASMLMNEQLDSLPMTLDLDPASTSNSSLLARVDQDSSSQVDHHRCSHRSLAYQRGCLHGVFFFVKDYLLFIDFRNNLTLTWCSRNVWSTVLDAFYGQKGSRTTSIDLFSHFGQARFHLKLVDFTWN